jgi:uncharacterized protein YkwD
MTNILGLLLLVFTSLSCIPKNIPHSSEVQRPPQEETTSPSNDSPLMMMLAEVNQLRAAGCRCGNKQMPAVPALKWNAKLEKAATIHAEDMQANDFFSHQGSDGSSVSVRASRLDYPWRHIGENIASGPTSVEDAMQGWISSPNHCKNMMSEDFREFAAARAGDLWVQVFGKQ